MPLRCLVSLHVSSGSQRRTDPVGVPPYRRDLFNSSIQNTRRRIWLFPSSNNQLLYCDSTRHLNPAQVESFFDHIRTGSVSEVMKSIKSGFNLQRRDAEEWTCLHWATEYGHEGLVLNLLDKEPLLLNMKTKEGLSAINIAAWRGNRRMVELLLEQGAEVDDRTKWGEGPLHHAVTFGYVEVCELLLQRGADPFREDKLKRSPFMIAMQKGSPALKKVFQKYEPTT